MFAGLPWWWMRIGAKKKLIGDAVVSAARPMSTDYCFPVVVGEECSSIK